MKVLIIVAMEKEATKLIEQLGLNLASAKQQLSVGLNTKIYHRHVDGHDIWLTLGGKDPIHQDVDCIGPLIQLVTYESIQKIKPDMIINAGTAGAIFKAGTKKHAVYIGSTAMSHDLHFPESDVKHKKLALGNYPVPDESELAVKLGFECAAISTTGSMLTTAEAKHQLETNKAKLVDMEWKYIVQVILRCTNADYQPRYLTVKVTTDFIDTEDCPQDQFEASMASDITKLLADACQKVIEETCQVKLGKDNATGQSTKPDSGALFSSPSPKSKASDSADSKGSIKMLSRL